MNLGIKHTVNVPPSFVDELEVTTSAAEAIETLAAANCKFTEIIQWTDNARFAAENLVRTNDPDAVVELLQIKESCESLMGEISGEFTAEAALESVGEALASAWETFKNWVKRVITAIVNLIKSVFGSDDKSDDKKMNDVVASAAADLPADAFKAKLDKPAEMIDGGVAKQTIDVYGALLKEMRDNRAADDAARKEFIAALSKLKDGNTSAVESANTKLTAIIDKQEKALEEATSKIADLEQKATVKATSLQEANWTPDGMKSIDDYYKKQIANIDADIRHEQDALREIEKAIDVVDQLYSDKKLFTGQYKEQKGGLEEQRKMRQEAIKTLQRQSRLIVKHIAELQKNAKWYRKLGLFVLRTLHFEEIGHFLKDSTIKLLGAFKPTGWIGRSAKWVGKQFLPSTWRKRARIKEYEVSTSTAKECIKSIIAFKVNGDVRLTDAAKATLKNEIKAHLPKFGLAAGASDADIEAKRDEVWDNYERNISALIKVNKGADNAVQMKPGLKQDAINGVLRNLKISQNELKQIIDWVNSKY